MENNIARPVQNSLDRFEEKFKNLLTSNVPFADFILQYVSEKQGKRIRPIVIFLSSKLHGIINHDAIQSALVIEMFHTATLIHDDVVDESNQRRGERTVNDRWNNKTAVLIGDFLFSKTLAGMVNLENREALKLLAKASEDITEGELLQIAYSGKSDLTESEYYNIIRNKTAVLFRIASQLGVLCNGGDQSHFERMGTFGDHFGMAFQIMDDVLDFIGSSDKMGKPSCKDIREKKLTLPLIHVIDRKSTRLNSSHYS